MGLTTRQFDAVARTFGLHWGLSTSEASRKVVVRLNRDFEELMTTDGSDVVALIVDSINFGKRPNQIL